VRRFSSIIIGLLVIAGLAVLGWKVWEPKKTVQNQVPQTTNQSTSETACPAVERAEVKVTDQGFDPAKVCVVQGGTVVWTNETRSSHRVASDPHPSHTDYPGFDDVRGEAGGGTYSFTFDRIGDWGYHDHADPSHTGRVVVTGR
jgi:plastocyanin